MRVLIVDDEALARDRLRQLLDEDEEHTIVGEAANGKDAIGQAARSAPDVVLLDIRMPGINGIEAAHHLNALDKPPAVVFTTAYDEYAIDAFDANAIGYLLKPVRRERLKKALQQAARLSDRAIDSVAENTGMETRRSHICVRVQDELLMIPIESIEYFQADQKYVRLHAAQGDHLIDDSLKALESEFADRFVRIHRSALVAVSHVRSLQKNAEGHTRVLLKNSEQPTDDLIISRRHLADVRRRLKGD